jgi:hypothetical protein
MNFYTRFEKKVELKFEFESLRKTLLVEQFECDLIREVVKVI